MKNIANKHNFFMNTKVTFTTIARPDREPDFESDGGESFYWYTEDGVVRCSNHWGESISSCSWFHSDVEKSTGLNHTDFICGFAKWEDFELKYTEIDIYENSAYIETVELTFDMLHDGGVFYKQYVVPFIANCQIALGL